MTAETIDTRGGAVVEFTRPGSPSVAGDRGASAAPDVSSTLNPHSGVTYQGTRRCTWIVAICIRVVAGIGVLAVAGVAGAISYSHGYSLALRAGEPDWSAHLLPITTDGLLLAAGMVLLDAARRGVRAPILAYLMLGLGISATLAANIAHGIENGPLGAIVAAWPAVALVGSTELLLRLLHPAASGAVSPVREAVPVDEIPASDPVSAPPVIDDPKQRQAAERFAEDLANGTVPGIRRIRGELNVGQPRARRIQQHLTALAHTSP